MPQQRSRTRAVIPGKAILGAAGAAEAARKTLGGAVVPGRAILGDLAAQEQARAAEARKSAAVADPGQAKGPKPKPTTKPAAAVPPLQSPQQAARAARKPAPKPGLSEGEAVAMLEADPESWEHILDLEAERADGMRPAIAAAVLRIAPALVENPVPADALVALAKIAGDVAPAAEAPPAEPAA